MSANGQRPVDDQAVVDRMIAVAQSGVDFGERLAIALARAAASAGGTDALLAGRPGSWEAGHVRDLLYGTVGPDDEHLDAYLDR